MTRKEKKAIYICSNQKHLAANTEDDSCNNFILRHKKKEREKERRWRGKVKKVLKNG